MEILTNFLYQMFFTVGVVVILGLVIALCRRAFCAIVGYHGPKILLITGIVGTPIHELSHALMCLIFGHKIDEIKLYDPYNEDGTLGYVTHSYNRKNPYHQIGNYFIGVAPILCGSGVLLLLMALLIPETSANITSELLAFDFSESSFGEYLGAFWRIVAELFDFSNMADFRWWIFILLAFLIATHMELSPADIRGSLIGVLFIAIIMLVMDLILSIFSIEAMEAVTSGLAWFSSYVAGFLAISGIFSIIMVLIALIVKGIVALVRR